MGSVNVEGTGVESRRPPKIKDGNEMLLHSLQKKGDKDSTGLADMPRLLLNCARSLRRLGTAKTLGIALATAVLGIVPAHKAEAQASLSVTVTWSYAQGSTPAIGFNVERSTVSGGPYTTINTALIPISTFSYSDTNVKRNTTYFYVLVAQAANGELSVNSVQAMAKVPKRPCKKHGHTCG